MYKFLIAYALFIYTIHGASPLTNLNLVSSNEFRLYVDTSLRKSTNPATVNALVGIRGSGATNLEYKTLLGSQNVQISHSGTNITVSVTNTPIFVNVGSSLIPISTNTFDLGSTLLPWRGLYVDDITIYDDLTVNDDVAVAGTLTVGGVDVVGVSQASGTYTPTIDILEAVNIGAVDTIHQAQYMRVGTVVTVSGAVTLTPTAGGGTDSSITISIPVASDFTTVYQAAGWGGSTGASASWGPVSSSIALNKAVLSFDSNSTGTPIVMYYNFTYQML